MPALQDGGTTSIQFTVEIVDINKEIKNKANVGGNDTEQNIIPTADINIAKDVVDITRNGVSVGKDAKVEVGDVIEYSITVTNTGSVELTNIEIQEKLEGVNIEGDLTKEKLAPGEQYIVKVTYTVTSEKDVFGNAEKIIYNKAIGSGDVPTDLENPEETEKVINEDDETTIVEDIPGLYVIKEADKTENVKVGETINYTIKVTNTGNVTLENVPVVDTITTSAGNMNLKIYQDKDCLLETDKIVKIKVGETVTLYTKYTVTQKDIDEQISISNIAKSTIPENGEQTTSEPEETVPEEKKPGLNIEKTATGIKKKGEETYSATIDKVIPGDVIEYTITVDNIGNTTLNNITVTDSLKVTVDGEEKEVNKETGVSTIAIIDSLAPDDELVLIKAYYTVTEADSASLDKIHNESSAISESGTTGKGIDETVPVNRDTTTTINIIWDDNQNQDGKRPQTVTINLYADGEFVKTETISGTNYTFEKLPTYNENGEKIVYTVTENAVNEYTTTYSGDTLTITNKHIPELTSVTIKKEWDDNQNQDGKRTDSVNVSVMNGATSVANETLSNDNSWTYTFENLPKYSNGTIIPYTVLENNIPEGYTPVITGDKDNGYTITNKHIPDTINIPVTKVWEDKDNYFNARKDIEVTLKADGTFNQKVTITEADGWKHTFENLPKYKDGIEIQYEILEDPIERYQTAITGDMTTGFTITNKYNNIVLNKKTLTSAGSSTTSEKSSLDVVFVLDISASMNDPIVDGDLLTRAEAMVEATNKAITEIMKDSNNRLGIVMFNNEAKTVLPLNHYTANTTSNDIGQYLEIEKGEYNDNYISTNVVESYEVREQIIEGTYTQLGIAAGANILLNAEDTYNRTPVIIVLTDGGPTYATTNYWNVTSTYNVGYGTESTNGDRGYLTVLTSNYYKNQVDSHYIGTDALMYTIGLGMTGEYAETIFNPTPENVNRCSVSSDNPAKELYEYLVGIKTNIQTNDQINVSVRNPYDDYNYADGSYVGEMSSEELEEILSDITENITKYYDITTDYATNINIDISRVELVNIDITKKITTILDEQIKEFSIQELMESSTVIKENEIYYIDLKSSMFENCNNIEIVYYDIPPTE